MADGHLFFVVKPSSLTLSGVRSFVPTAAGALALADLVFTLYVHG